MEDAGEAQLDALVEELKGLRQGLGMRRSVLAPVVGPVLRRTLDLDAEADESRVRLAVADGLMAAARGLEPEVQLVVLFALAVRSDRRTLQERLAAAAERIDRDQRTAHRRMSEGTVALAGNLLEGRARRVEHPMAPTGWTTLSMRSTVDLTLHRPAFVGTKTILAVERLTSLTESVTLSPQEGVQVEVLSGGRRGPVQRLGAATRTFAVELDRVVPAGGTHTYTMRVSVETADGFAPLNAMVPMRPCASFTAEVRFAPSAMPDEVQRLDGLPVAELHGPQSHYGRVPAEPVMTASFEALVPGLCYGLRWG